MCNIIITLILVISFLFFHFFCIPKTYILILLLDSQNGTTNFRVSFDLLSSQRIGYILCLIRLYKVINDDWCRSQFFIFYWTIYLILSFFDYPLILILSFLLFFLFLLIFKILFPSFCIKLIYFESVCNVMDFLRVISFHPIFFLPEILFLLFCRFCFCF